MDLQYKKIPSALRSDVNLKVIEGHFASTHSHITHYLDLSTLKSRCSEARGVAELLAMSFSLDTPVDTIVCIDGTQVIGTYLADELTKAGVLSYNAHRTIYVVAPEYSSAGQILFRDNMIPAIRDKYALILMGAVTTGKTVEDVIYSLQYYQAKVSGACAIFSAVDSIRDVRFTRAFSPEDVPGYASYDAHACPMCRQKQKIDALVNSFGYSRI